MAQFLFVFLIIFLTEYLFFSFNYYTQDMDDMIVSVYKAEVLRPPQNKGTVLEPQCGRIEVQQTHRFSCDK